MTKNIAITLTSEGFIYKGWTIVPFEDWEDVHQQTEVIWYGAEKVVNGVWYWKKRTCLIKLIEDIDNEATTN